LFVKTIIRTDARAHPRLLCLYVTCAGSYSGAV